MVENSSKFGVSRRQSILAFVVMISLIFAASSFSGQISSAQAGLPEELDKVMVEPTVFIPTPTPEALEPSSPINYFSFMPAVARAEPSLPSTVVAAGATSTATAAQPTEQVPTPTVPAPTQTPQAEQPAVAQVESTPTAQIEPMPELPPEAPYVAFDGRSYGDYPGWTRWPDIQVPEPLGILPHPENQVNILLLGSDQRQGDTGFRTDTIQLLTINPSEGSARLTSYPRDLYVYIPGYTMERINTAFGWGGFDALADTMDYNFGVKPDYYVLINFWSFKEVIDSIGGVRVEVGRDFCDHRDDWGNFCVSQSTYWMDGESALWYVRARYTTSDIDRGRRQQEVLIAAFNQLISLNGLKRAPELYNIYKENVTTNMDFDVVSSLLPVAAHLAQTREIKNFSIGSEQVYNWINSYGAQVLVPMRDPVFEVMQQVISEP